MFKLFKLIKSAAFLSRRLEEDKVRQEKEGYSIEFTQHGPERYITYREDNREVYVGADFTSSNDVILFTDSFIKWDVPRGEELTDFDYQKVLNRLVRYFSCWGGEVTLDNTKLQDLEQIKADLRERGISFTEHDGIIMYESTVEDEMKSENSPFNQK